MASSGRPTITKRQRERAREERRRAKAEKRAQRKAEKEARPEVPNGEDPDLAGIVPGPQPIPWEQEDEEPA